MWGMQLNHRTVSRGTQQTAVLTDYISVGERCKEQCVLKIVPVMVTEMMMEKMWRKVRHISIITQRFRKGQSCMWMSCPPICSLYLWVVLHDTADLLYYINAALSVQGVDQLGQVGVTVPDGPVLQRGIRPLVIWRVAIGEGGHLPLRGVGQRLINVYPVGAHMSCHQPQDIHPWAEWER